jgi:hypothetical protein
MAQGGSLYTNSIRADGKLIDLGDTCYLKYYIIVDGKRVHKTIQLCQRDHTHDWWFKRGKWGFSSAVRDLQRETMDRINAEAKALELAKAQPETRDKGEMRVVDFWETQFLPYCEKVREVTGEPRMKASTVRGFKQIWGQHLKAHFGETSLVEYEPVTGSACCGALWTRSVRRP